MKRAIIFPLIAIFAFCAGLTGGYYLIPKPQKESVMDLHRRDSLIQVLSDTIASWQARSNRETAEYIAFVEGAIQRSITNWGENKQTKPDLDKWRESIEQAKAGQLDDQKRLAWQVETMRQQIEILKAIR